MRFYVPEWDDAVDTHYDFEHDELSTLDRQERELDYIWDIFERGETPIDGVLISREQVEETNRKANRLEEHGVYDDPVLSVPDWLPTISDCGAWGYKALPFPPYSNEGMLEFYRTLEVSVGVTIDHLVLGSGKEKGRLYLDERGFENGIDQDDLSDELVNAVDLMIEEWPDEWPEYVDEYEPSIRTSVNEDVERFSKDDFAGDVDSVLDRLSNDPRAVYREDDAEFRYDLTLRNAKEMFDLYQSGDYSFRLMVAIQGWDPESYVTAANRVLDIGYDYVGIGGVAGSPVHAVRQIVTAVGKAIKSFEREHTTRIDTHVFGFAKTEAFETIGRSGMSSFDSASMLRAAWTGSGNYRLDRDDRYDAIRVRYPSTRDDLETTIETALRGREVLFALRAYDAGESITTAVTEWHRMAEELIPNTREYLIEHRHDDRYDRTRLQDIERAFRDDFDSGRELKASFGGPLRDRLVKLLRKDDRENPLPFEEYNDLLKTAAETLPERPWTPDSVDAAGAETDTERILAVVRQYANWIGDEKLIPEYERTLRNRPWEECDCPICDQHGIEVCIFRGNDRNRRRGFHNTRRFYDEFAEELPKILVTTQASAGLIRYGTVERYLENERTDFWQRVYDLPVVEIGVLHADGVQEWWEATPDTVSLSPTEITERLRNLADRYQYICLLETEAETGSPDSIDRDDCQIRTFSDPDALREAVLETCGGDYQVGADFLPQPPEFDVSEGLDVLVIDQCSGSKAVPEDAPVFDKTETLHNSRETFLSRDNVPAIVAKDLYTGRQQKFVKEAVRQLKRNGHNVDRYFISAGFGLVGEEDTLPPYEVTFSSMRVDEIRNRSRQLGIKRDVEQLLNEAEYDIVFFALGGDYYTSIDIDQMVQNVRSDRIAVVFNRELVDDQFENVVSVPARTDDAKRHDTIVIGLKGVYMKNFANRLDEQESIDPATVEVLCRRIDEEPDQSGFKKFQKQ